MSDVIRNAVIKLAIQLQTPSLNLPDLGATIKQQEDLAKATQAVTAANQTAAAAAAQAAKETITAAQSATSRVAAEAQTISALESQAKAVAAVASENAKLDAAYLRLASSSIGVVKGAAFIAAGYSDSLNAVLPYMFAVQGLHTITTQLSSAKLAYVAIIKAETVANGVLAASMVGVATAIKAIDAALGPIGWLLLAASAAIYSVHKAYRTLIPSQEEVNKQLEEQRQKQEAANQALDDARQRYDIIVDAQMQHIDLLKTEGEKSQALFQAMNDPSLTADQRLSAARKELDILDKGRQNLEKQKRDRIELINLRDRELKTAQQALKVEQDKDQALRASIGALNAGEKKKLDKLTTKVESGGTLTQKEAIDFQKLGGEAGQKIGEKFLAQLDGGLGQRLEKLIGDPLSKAQAEFARRQQALNKETRGASAEDAIKSVNELNDELVRGLDAVTDVVRDKLHELIEAVKAQQLEQSRQRSAARAANARTDAK